MNLQSLKSRKSGVQGSGREMEGATLGHKVIPFLNPYITHKADQCGWNCEISNIPAFRADRGVFLLHFYTVTCLITKNYWKLFFLDKGFILY